MRSSKKILLGVTGSIAAYKSADIIRRLREANYKISVVMSKEAEQFITPLTLGSLCGEKVYRDMFDGETVWNMPHIRLAQESGLFLIAPATANTIGKIAIGLADDLISTIAMATQAKILFAPAMNDQMYQNPILQENIKRLKNAGMHFINPVKGSLACGSFGEGHLAEVEDIVTAVKKIF